MRTRFIVVLSLVLLATGAAAPVAASTGANNSPHSTNTSCSYPFTTTDATGTQVTISQAPQRVVTLNPSAAQIMWDIGGKSKVVGVSQYASYLKGASSRTNVTGSSHSVDEEKVINLKPDLVLAPNTIPNSTVHKLRQANLTVYRYHSASSMSDIEHQTRLTGKLTGECGGAQQIVSKMHSQIAKVRSAVKGMNRTRALYTFFGYTDGKGTFINDMIHVAGGDNVAADAGITRYKKISKETIINQNPQWIIRDTNSPSVPHNKAYNSTYAIKHGNVIVLNVNYINQPAPRSVEAVKKLAKAWHPKAYANANLSAPGSTNWTASMKSTTSKTTTTQATTRGSSTSSTSTSSSSSSGQGTTSSSSPGFGVGVAVLGLLSAIAVIAMRRNA